jgi:hypothetical protein
VRHITPDGYWMNSNNGCIGNATHASKGELEERNNATIKKSSPRRISDSDFGTVQIYP